MKRKRKLAVGSFLISFVGIVSSGGIGGVEFLTKTDELPRWLWLAFLVLPTDVFIEIFEGLADRVNRQIDTKEE